MKLTMADQCFRQDGKPFFLYCGEVQYFRIPPEKWRTHLDKLKKAGANAVATYIPWSWHEYADQECDFTGATDPRRDVVRFLELTREVGLYVIIKPGPYIVAEFNDKGIPGWLTAKHPEIMAQGVQVVTYLHKTYLAYVRRWYDQVLKIIEPRQVTRGGNILMLQVCNEVGLYQWLDGQGDTGKVSLEYFQKYLKREYKTIRALNKTYGSRYRDFGRIPAPSTPTRNAQEFVRWNDWHDFHRWYYGEYLSLLIKEITQRNIDIQLIHNVPGWVYGRAQEYPVNITFYAEALRRNPNLLLGLDHIPENPTYRNQHDDLVINEMVRAMQGREKPLLVIEQQAGTREHGVHTFPREMELFYKASLGRGITGMNLYMFSQGINPERTGATGPTFYWMTALNPEGEEKPLYAVTAKLGRIIGTFGQALAQTRKRAGTGVVFYRPYYHDEFYYPLFGGVLKLNARSAGLRYDPKQMRNMYYFDGLLRILNMQNHDFDLQDLQSETPDPKRTSRLYVMAQDRMDPDSQEKLAQYVETGGHLILFPGFPDQDLKMRPCLILQERLGIQEGPEAVLDGFPKMDLFEFKDISCLAPIRTYSAEGSEIIARTAQGESCGLTRRVGRGRITVLGTAFSYGIKEHLFALAKLQALAGSRPAAVEVDNPQIQAHLRYGKDYAFLTLLNYTPETQPLQALARDIPGAGELRIPEAGVLRLPPVSGLLIPLHYPVPGSDIRLLWTTCEILSLAAEPHGWRAEVKQVDHQASEMAFKIPDSLQVVTVTYDRKPVVVQQTGTVCKINITGLEGQAELVVTCRSQAEGAR